MSVEDNKKSLTRSLDEVWNNGNYSIIPEVISPDYIYTNGGDKGLEGFEQFVKNMRTTFPDLHYAVDEMIGEGNTLATRVTLTGTFLGKMGNIEPTGKSIKLTHVLISRFADGKCIETTSFHDMLAFSQQLGITG